MATPWQNGSGQPIVDGDGKIIECDDCPCEVETVVCDTSLSRCVDGIVPAQMIATLPSVTHGDAAQFSDAGGSFVLDPYDNVSCLVCTPFAFSAGGPPIGAEAHPFFGSFQTGACAYFGAVLGVQNCGRDVRPFGIFRFYSNGSTDEMFVGYAEAVAASGLTPTRWRPIIFPGFTVSLPAYWSLGSPALGDCTVTFSTSVSSASSTDLFNCALTTHTTAGSTSATTVSFGPA